MTTRITAQLDAAKNINVRIAVADSAGNETGLPSRYVLQPGTLVAGQWVATDISTQPAEVTSIAAAMWTQPVVDACKARLLAAYVPPVDPAILDQQTLNDALAAPGSVVRALALVLLQEINILRVKAGLPAYTSAQLVTALQAKMR